MLEPGIYTKGKLDVVTVYRNLLTEGFQKNIGAVITFLGIVRETGKNEKQVSNLEMESYEEHANKSMKKICEEVKKKYNLSMIVVYHMLGEFQVGEPVVFVIAAGKKRDEAFAGIQEAIKRYKTEPALWKKEVYIDGLHEWLSGA